MSETKEHYPKNKPTRPGKYFWRWLRRNDEPGDWQGPMPITQDQLDNSEVDGPDSHQLCRPDVEFGERCLSQESLVKVRALAAFLAESPASSKTYENVVGKKLLEIIDE